MFYGIYYDNLKPFDQETRLKLYEAIIEFSLEGLEPNFDKGSEIYRAWNWIRYLVKEYNCYDESEDIIKFSHEREI